MNARAIIVGVDAYARSPLTSAVTDAVEFRRAVLELELAREDETSLLTSPPVDGAAGEATYAEITSALQELYFDGDTVDRLIFYFAGHGLLAFSDPAMSQSGTALLPVDIDDVERNARNLIHLDELMSYLRLAGPSEQLFFVDACRDLPYKRQPQFSSLGWGGRPPGPPRRQAALYAVAELGQSQSVPGGQGAMSRRLVEALRGDGSALDYDLDRDGYVVTMESVRNYVRAKVAADLGGGGFDFALPALDRRDPTPAPIREISSPPPRSLTVHVEPDGAMALTTVHVAVGRSLIVQSWPPLQNHATVMLEPRPYRLTAETVNGITDPATCVVDVREQSVAVVRVLAHDDATDRASLPNVRAVRRTMTGETRGSVLERDDSAGPDDGRLRVGATDQAVAIDVVGLEPPYRRLSELGHLHATLPAGAYRVDFRFGPDRLSSTDVYIAAGDEIVVRAPGGDDFARRASRGKLAAAQAQLLGLAPFMGADVQPEFGGIPDELRSSVRGFARPVVVVVESPDGRVDIAGNDIVATPIETPYGTVGMAVAEVEARSFVVSLGPEPAIAVVSATLENRVTVISRRRISDGRLDVSHNLFARPDRPRLPYDETPEPVELAKLLETGQQLYKSGELLKATDSNDVSNLLYAKWTDPIFGCMGIYAAEANRDREPYSPLRQAAHNLLSFFAPLPDASIAASLELPERERLLAEVLESDARPLLRQSAGILARFAHEVGATGHPAIERYARIPAGQPWNLQPIL